MQERLDNNNVLVYSTYNEDKSVIAKQFLKVLKAKIYKRMTAKIANLILVIWIN